MRGAVPAEEVTRRLAELSKEGRAAMRELARERAGAGGVMELIAAMNEEAEGAAVEAAAAARREAADAAAALEAEQRRAAALEERLAAGASVKDAAADLAGRTGRARRALYARAIELREGNTSVDESDPS